MTSPIEKSPCFHHVIQHWAQARPDTIAFHYLPDGEKVSTSLSYAELDRQARLTALMLQGKGLSKQPILLQFRPGIDFIVAFFGCLYAGAIAVSAYPPGSNRSKSDRLQKLIATSQATTILTNKETLDDVRRESDADAFALLCIEEAQGGDAEVWMAPTLTGEDIAFLQYSSGSTGDPKGVIITHTNLMSNQFAIRQGMGNGDHTVFASWLPLFHDMGLIGNVMQPLYLGVSCWLMPPMAFLQKPVRWLRLISAVGATCSGGPDFAYALCVNSISDEERAGLDLSRWEVAYNGAEPVRSETVARFQAVYTQYGLRHGALYPCYGLAEATLFVSGSVAGQSATTLRVDSERLSAGVVLPTTAEGTTLVSSGQLWGGTQLTIADPERRTRCADGEVGEIWLRGDSISRGYWNAPEANNTLLATLVDDVDTLCLRTGDLGFIYAGQLYVTGRLKEVLIVRGRNHYPQDIEHTVQSSDSQFVTGSGVAFISGDALVVVQEVRRSAVRRFDAARALERARSAVADHHGLTLAHLVAVKPGSVAKTSSGKLRRRYMRGQWQAGHLTALGSPALTAEPDSTTVSTLLALLAAKGLDAHPQQTLSMLGVDSLLRLELHTLLQQQCARTIPLDWLLADLTLEKLEQQIALLPEAEALTEDHTPEENAATTPWQQAIWLHQQTQPGAAFYNLATLLPLPPGHTAEQVQQILMRLSAAHPQLAATLTGSGWTGGAQLMLECVDVSDWTAAQRSSWLFDFRARPFDLTASVPWRCALQMEQGQGRQLAIAVHHMIIDHTAAQTLLHDLRQLLAGERCPAAASNIPLLPASLHSSARPDMQAEADWLAALCATPEHQDFNLVKPAQPAALASVRHTLAATETRALKHYARQAGVTLHVLLAAAFSALLARYSGETRLALGVPVSVRAPLQARCLTNAVNILPLVLHFDDDTTFKTLIEQVGAQTHLLLRHRFLPYLSLLEQVRRHQPQRVRLYHAVFACQSETEECPPYIPATAAQSPFSLLAFPSSQQIVLELEFDPQLCDSHSAQRLLGHLQHWLDEALMRPDSAIGQICYLSLAEQAEMGLLTCPQVSVQHHEDVITRFTHQVTLSPEAIAVEDDKGACSYAQLQRLAQGYAALLQHQQVQPGERIGLAMTRDRHLPAAMLAIQAAGACYVPLDLSYPPDRLAMMMEDSQCRIIMARDPALFPERHVISPADLRPEVTRPLAAVSLDAIAYVLYTSGSTGRPKGVQVTQRNISALLNWAQASLSDTERERVLASTSICFDLSVFEFFVPLCLGTCCVIVERILDLAGHPRAVSLVNTVPSAIEALLQAGAFPAQTQVALVAGEPFRQALVDRLLSQVALPRLLDLYGPTEDTVYSTCARRYAGGDETIGLPLPGTRLYVLDRFQQPVAHNMPGELWLAGEKLSQGYLQRPELNAAAFTVPAALSHLESRAYRTGDRVRRQADGRLVYLGRLDHQIKLNGYRIETGEVERCLLRLPGIQQAVVNVVENVAGQKQLAAWYVATGEDPGSSELRRQLMKTLPEWMLPSIWLALTALPQTPNGKIDRRALPLPAAAEPPSRPLQREDERQLADIWQQVLGQRPQDREAHFISLGGNSLLAVQLCQQLSRILNIDVPLTLLLNHRVFGEQADALADWVQQAQPCDDIEEISL